MQVLIKNGLIVDGTGVPSYKGDVLINGDTIEKIAESIDIEGADIIDATNKIVSPGFIDIHNHADFNLYDINRAESFIMQGMTTLLVGLCGLGVAPATRTVEEYYSDFGKKALGIDPKLFATMKEFHSELEKKGISINTAFLIPQGNVRCCVMGLAMRPATDDEMKKMKDMVREGMEAGAFGLSSGLVYPPGSSTPTEELIELSKVVAEYDGIYNSHMRNEGAQILTEGTGMPEIIRVGKEAKVRTHISHWSVISKFQVEKITADAIQLFENALAEGVNLTADVVPYFDGVTSLPFVILENWVFEDLIGNLTRKEAREQVKLEIFERINAMFLAGAPWYLKIIPKFLLRRLMMPVIAKQVVILNSTSGEFNGKTLREALKTKYPKTGIADALLNFIRDEEGGILIRIEFKDEVKSVVPLLKRPYSCASSDAVLVPGANNHPRAYSAFPHIIERMVRENQWLTLEEAIKKMTSQPAKILNIKDRGVLKEGAKADIVIFDYKKIHQVATVANGNQHPEGVEYVLVNGQITVEKGEHLGNLDGKILKHKL